MRLLDEHAPYDRVTKRDVARALTGFGFSHRGAHNLVRRGLSKTLEHLKSRYGQMPEACKAQWRRVKEMVRAHCTHHKLDDSTFDFGWGEDGKSESAPTAESVVLARAAEALHECEMDESVKNEDWQLRGGYDAKQRGKKSSVLGADVYEIDGKYHEAEHAFYVFVDGVTKGVVTHIENEKDTWYPWCAWTETMSGGNFTVRTCYGSDERGRLAAFKHVVTGKVQPGVSRDESLGEARLAEGNFVLDTMKWERTLQVGSRVEVRWTWGGGYYGGPGVVTKLNMASAKVRTDAEVRYMGGGVAPREITAPRCTMSTMNRWSANNGLFPLDGKYERKLAEGRYLYTPRATEDEPRPCEVVAWRASNCTVKFEDGTTKVVGRGELAPMGESKLDEGEKVVDKDGVVLFTREEVAKIHRDFINRSGKTVMYFTKTKGTVLGPYRVVTPEQKAAETVRPAYEESRFGENDPGSYVDVADRTCERCGRLTSLRDLVLGVCLLCVLRRESMGKTESTDPELIWNSSAFEARKTMLSAAGLGEWRGYVYAPFENLPPRVREGLAGDPESTRLMARKTESGAVLHNYYWKRRKQLEAALAAADASSAEATSSGVEAETANR